MDEAESKRADAWKLYEAQLAGSGGNAPDWSECERLHPELTAALRELRADIERGRELVDGVGLGVEDEDEDEEDLTDLVGKLSTPRDHRSLEFLAVIGRGGMAVVERVLDRRLDQQLARKTLPIAARGPYSVAEGRRLRRFLREVHVCSHLQHPGILPVLDVGVDERDRPFFIMPLVRGLSLSEVLAAVRRGGSSWTLPRVLQVLVSVCETVAYAHAHGVVHRDLKPANIMVGRYGEVFVMDWGLAKVLPRRGGEADRAAGPRPEVDAALTLEGDVVGTPAYMAPEQAAGLVDSLGALTDQYSIGAMLYELLAGQRPYAGSAGSAAEIVEEVRGAAPKPVAELAPRAAPELVAICTKAMQREPRSRYASVEALSEDLRAYLEQRVVLAHASGTLVSLRKWIQRNRLLASVLAFAVVMAIGFPLAFLSIEARRNARLGAANETLRQVRDELDGRVAELHRAVYWSDLESVQRALRDGHDAGGAQQILAATDPALRGWEWHLLASLADSSRATWPGRFGMAVSPGGRLVCAAGRNFRTVVWRVDTGEEVGALASQGVVDAAGFSPDGTRVATWSMDHRLRILDLGKQETIEVPVAASRWNVVEFSPDGRQLLVRSEKNTLVHVAAETGAIVRTVPVGDQLLIRADWCSDGRLALGGDRGALYVLDGPAGPARELPRFSSRGISGLRLVAGTDRLVAVDPDGQVAEYTGEELATSTLELGRFTRVDFSTDGRLIAFDASGDSALFVRDLESETTWRLPGHRGVFENISFAGPRELFTSSSDGTTKYWDLDRLPESAVEGLGGPISDVSVAPDGRSIVAAVGSRIASIQLGRREPVFTELDLGRIGRVRHAPGGATLAAVGQRPRLAIVGAEPPHEQRYLGVEIAGSLALDFTPDGRGILAGADAMAWWNAAIWSPEPGVSPTLFTVATAPRCGRFSPDGARFALAGSDGCVALRRSDTAEELARVVVSDMRLQSVAWSRDGHLIAAGGRRPNEDWAIALIDPDEARITAELSGAQGECCGLAFTTDGRLISATGDATVRVWDLERRRCLVTLSLGTGNVPLCLDLSRDDSVLAVGTNTGRVHVWDLHP